MHDEVLDYTLEGKTLTSSSQSIGAIVSKPKKHVQDKLIRAGAALCETGTWLWGGFLTNLLQTGHQPVLIVIRLRYDETPTKVRVVETPNDSPLNPRLALNCLPKSCSLWQPRPCPSMKHHQPPMQRYSKQRCTLLFCLKKLMWKRTKIPSHGSMAQFQLQCKLLTTLLEKLPELVFGHPFRQSQKLKDYGKCFLCG